MSSSRAVPDISPKQVFWFTCIDILWPVHHPERDTLGIGLRNLADPIDILILRCPIVSFSSTFARDAMIWAVCIPTPLIPVSAMWTGFVPVQVGIADPYEILDIFFLSHPIPR